MGRNTISTITSLLAVFFFTLHLTDEVLRGQVGFINVLFVVLLVVWLYAILFLAGRRWGYVLNMLFSLVAAVLAFGHLTGLSDTPTTAIATSSGPFYVWGVLELAVVATASLLFAAYGLFTPAAGKRASAQ